MCYGVIDAANIIGFAQLAKIFVKKIPKWVAFCSAVRLFGPIIAKMRGR